MRPERPMARWLDGGAMRRPLAVTLPLSIALHAGLVLIVLGVLRPGVLDRAILVELTAESSDARPPQPPPAATPVPRRASAPPRPRQITVSERHPLPAPRRVDVAPVIVPSPTSPVLSGDRRSDRARDASVPAVPAEGLQREPALPQRPAGDREQAAAVAAPRAPAPPARDAEPPALAPIEPERSARPPDRVRDDASGVARSDEAPGDRMQAASTGAGKGRSDGAAAASPGTHGARSPDSRAVGGLGGGTPAGGRGSGGDSPGWAAGQVTTLTGGASGVSGGGEYWALVRRRIAQTLRYPPSARRRGLAGTVELEIMMRPDGRVDDVKVITSSSHDLLDEAAVDAVRRLPAIPAPAGLAGAELRIVLPVAFDLR